MVKPARRRELARQVKAEYFVSIRIACEVLSISTCCYNYQARLSNENAEIADWLLRLTTANKRWGFGLWVLAYALCSYATAKDLNGITSVYTVFIVSLN